MAADIVDHPLKYKPVLAVYQFQGTPTEAAAYFNRNDLAQFVLNMNRVGQMTEVILRMPLQWLINYQDKGII